MTILPNSIESIEGLPVSDQIKVMYEYIQYIQEQLTWFTSAKKLSVIAEELSKLTETVSDGQEATADELAEIKTDVVSNLKISLASKGSSIDADTITETGVYLVPNTADHLPVQYLGMILHINGRAASDAAVQFYVRESVTSFTLYMRKRSTEWGEWKKITFA